MGAILLQGLQSDALILQGFGARLVEVPVASALNLAQEQASGDDATASSGIG